MSNEVWLSPKLIDERTPVMPREPTIPEAPETPLGIDPVAKEQKITPFDVEGGVDEEGKSLGM